MSCRLCHCWWYHQPAVSLQHLQLSLEIRLATHQSCTHLPRQDDVVLCVLVSTLGCSLCVMRAVWWKGGVCNATTPAQVKLFVSSPSYRKSCQGYKLPKLMIVYIDLYTLQAFERRNSPLPENHPSCCYTHTYTPLHPYSCRQQPHAVCLYSQFNSLVTHICTTGGTTRERGAFLEGGLIQSEDHTGWYCDIPNHNSNPVNSLVSLQRRRGE